MSVFKPLRAVPGQSQYSYMFTVRIIFLVSQSTGDRACFTGRLGQGWDLVAFDISDHVTFPEGNTDLICDPVLLFSLMF